MDLASRAAWYNVAGFFEVLEERDPVRLALIQAGVNRAEDINRSWRKALGEAVANAVWKGL